MDECPDIIHIKCICHSLALCASKACEKQLMRDIYNYLSNSLKRSVEFETEQVIVGLESMRIFHSLREGSPKGCD